MGEKLRKARNLGLSATLAVGIASDYYAEDPFILPDLARDYISGENCDADSSFSTEIDLVFPDTDQEFIKQERHDVAQGLAAESGLTLIDERPFLGAVENAETYRGVLNGLNDYSSELGIEFSIPERYELNDIPIRYYFLRDVPDLDGFKESAKKVMNELYYVPKEIHDLSNVREVKLVKDIYAEDAIEALTDNDRVPGKYNFASRIAYINIDSLDRVFMHEYAHSIDFNSCGIIGALNDEAFGELNPEGFRYGKTPGDVSKIAYNKYGETNIAEDKAEVLENLVLPYSRIDPRNLSTIVQNKLTLELERIDELAPGYYDYWKSLSIYEFEKSKKR